MHASAKKSDDDTKQDNLEETPNHDVKIVIVIMIGREMI